MATARSRRYAAAYLACGTATRVARVPVQGLPLPGGLQQPLLVGLAVHGHEFVREFGEHAHRHGPAAEMGARAPLGGDGTADQQRTVVEFGARLLGPHARPCRRRTP